MKRKGQEDQINKIAGEKRDIEYIVLTSRGSLGAILKTYPNKLEKSRKTMDKFLDTYDLPRLNQEDTKNISRLITSNEIEAAIKQLPIKKTPGPERFTAEFYQTFRRTNTIMKLCHKQVKLILPNSFYKNSISLMPKPDKEAHTKRKL
jgi:hypothetical protein